MGAVGALGNATCTGVVQLSDNLPAIPAGFTGLARVAIGVVASVLIQRDGVSEVVVTDKIATASTVMPSEEPCEGLVADVASIGGFIRLPVCGGGSGGDFSPLLIEQNLAGFSAETLAHGLEIVRIGRVVEEAGLEVHRVWGVRVHAKAAVIAGRWCVRCTWTSGDVHLPPKLLRRSQRCWCVERLTWLAQLPWLVVGVVAVW